MSERQIYSEEDIQKMSRWGGLEADEVRETVGRGGLLKPEAEKLRDVSIIQLPCPDRRKYSEATLSSILHSSDKKKKIHELADQLREGQLGVIYQDAKKRFPGKTIGIRGVSCSIDEPVVLKNKGLA